MTPEQRINHRAYQGETGPRKKTTEDMPKALRRRAVEEQRDRKAEDWWGK